jgi:hypothetical protein
MLRVSIYAFLFVTPASDGRVCCFFLANSDSAGDPIVGGVQKTVADNSVENCISTCQGHSVIALENGTECCTLFVSLDETFLY